MEVLDTLVKQFQDGAVLTNEELNLIISHINLIVDYINTKIKPVIENGIQGRDGRNGVNGRDGVNGIEGISTVNAFVGAVSDADALSKFNNNRNQTRIPTGFSSTPNISLQEGLILFMTSARKRGENWLYTDGYIWSIPVLLGSNTTSTTGVDTDSINYIYCRTKRNEDAQDFFPSSNILLKRIIDYIEENPNNGIRIEGQSINNINNIGSASANAINGSWTDHPYGINEDLPHEWMVGFKKNLEGEWEYYFGPVMISNYGFNGLDGDGYEYIFSRNDSKTTSPEISNISSNGKTYDLDDFLPVGWTDEPQGVANSPGHHYEWVSTRKKSGNPSTWGPFSLPSLWASYAIPGKLGSYKLWAYKNAESINEIPESNGTYPPDGWGATATTPDFANGEYTWCIDRTVTFDDNNNPIYDVWSNPAYRISGDNGQPGEDGEYTEFIYKRSDVPLTFSGQNDPSNWDTSSAADSRGNTFKDPDYIGPSVAGWTDNPQGIGISNETLYKYEYMSLRKYNGISFDSFIPPVLWSKWGEKGEDGDGVEYIFYASPNETTALNGNLYPPNWTTDADFLNNDYIRSGSGWDDEPIDLNGSGLGLGSVEWVSVRRKTNNTWGAYSSPVIWSRLAKDGIAEGYIVDFSNENMPVATSANGDVPSYTNLGTIQVYYNGTPLTYDSNGGAGHFSYSIGTITRSDGNTVNSSIGASSEKIIATTSGANISISMANVSNFDTKNAYIPVTVTLPNGSTNSFNITLFGIATGPAGQPGDAIDLFLTCSAIRTNYNLTSVTPSAIPVGVKIGKNIYYSHDQNNSAESLGYSFKYYYDNLSSTPFDVPNNGQIILSANGGNNTPLQTLTVLMYYTPSGGTTILVDLEVIPYIKDGELGNGIVSITRTFAISSTGTTASETTEPIHVGSWSISSPAVTESYPYLWAKEVVVFTDTTKNTTKYYCIGAKGSRGIDAKDIEWVYIRTKTNIAPVIYDDENYDDSNALDYTEDDHLPKVIPGNGGQTSDIENNEDTYECTDNPKGVNDTWKFEWEIKREKSDSNNGIRSWIPYNGPMTLHNNLAESAFIIDTDNDNDQFGTDSNSKVLVAQTRSTTVKLYDGSTPQTLKTNGGLTVELKYEDDTSIPITGANAVATYTATPSTGVVEVTILQNTNTAFSHSAIKAVITATDTNNRSKQTTFTIRKVMSGLPGLSPIIYLLSPTQKTFSFYRDTGNNLLPANYSSQINVARTEGNTTTILSTALAGITYSWGFDDSSTAQESDKAVGTSISISNSVANSHYLVWVELSTGDKETLPIVKDGTSGTINPNILLRTLFKSIPNIQEKWLGDTSVLSEYYTPTPENEKINGYNIIRAELDDSTAMDIFQNITLQGNTWYTFSFWLRLSTDSEIDNTAPILSVYMSYDSSGNGGGLPGCVSEYYVDNSSIQTFNDGGTEFSGGTYNPTKHTIRFKTVADMSVVNLGCVRFRFRGGYNIISMPKLELGLVATAYVANEADLEGKYSPYEEKQYANYDSENTNINGAPSGNIQGSWSSTIPATDSSYPYLWLRVRTRTYNVDNLLVSLGANEGWSYGLLTKPGAAGSAGRMYYPAGEYDSSIEYTRNNNICPVVHYTDDNYWYLNADTNVVNNTHIAPSSTSGNPWQLAENYGLVITEALFTLFAKFGSFIVSEDFFISLHGTLISSSGEVEVTSSSTLNKVYINNGTPYLVTSEGDVACYTYFNAIDPMAETAPTNSNYKFRPMKVINAKTGEEWTAGGNVHIDTEGNASFKGTIKAENLYRKVAFTWGGTYGVKTRLLSNSAKYTSSNAFVRDSSIWLYIKKGKGYIEELLSSWSSYYNCTMTMNDLRTIMPNLNSLSLSDKEDIEENYNLPSGGLSTLMDHYNVIEDTEIGNVGYIINKYNLTTGTYFELTSEIYDELHSYQFGGETYLTNCHSEWDELINSLESNINDSSNVYPLAFPCTYNADTVVAVGLDPLSSGKDHLVYLPRAKDFPGKLVEISNPKKKSNGGIRILVKPVDEIPMAYRPALTGGGEYNYTKFQILNALYGQVGGSISSYALGAEETVLFCSDGTLWIVLSEDNGSIKGATSSFTIGNYTYWFTEGILRDVTPHS